MPLGRLKRAVCISLLGGIPSFCLAQVSGTPGAPPALRLSLADAVKLAMKQNPRRIIAGLGTSISDRERQATRALLLPQADMTADAYIDRYNAQSVLANPNPAVIGPFQVFETGPRFSQSVFDLPLIRQFQASKQNVVTASADESATRESVTAAVVQGYLLTLRSDANLEAVRAQVTLAERLYLQAEDLQKNGLGLRIDTLRSNVELQNQRQRLIDAETATRTTRYALAELLLLPPNEPFELTDRMAYDKLVEVDRNSLLSQALATRPEMKSIVSRQRTAHLAQQAASESRLPRLNFFGDWLYQGRHFSDGIPAYDYELALEFPLFTSGRIQAGIARSRLQEQQVEEERRSVEAQITREVRTAADELDAARKSVEVAELGLQLARDEVAQAERRFKAGVTTNVEVIVAQNSLARASDNEVEALYRFNQSRANLARAVGAIESTYGK
jgi:outer membrane protein TolC